MPAQALPVQHLALCLVDKGQDCQTRTFHLDLSKGTWKGESNSSGCLSSVSQERPGRTTCKDGVRMKIV